MDGDSFEVTCPTCYEVFEVPSPPAVEVPVTFDYDCQVCCSPMVIACDLDHGLVVGYARGLAD